MEFYDITVFHKTTEEFEHHYIIEKSPQEAVNSIRILYDNIVIVSVYEIQRRDGWK